MSISGGLAGRPAGQRVARVVDYYVLRRQPVAVEDLFREHGRHAYRAGWNPLAITVFVVGALPATTVALVPALTFSSPFSWFRGAGYAVIARHTARITLADISGSRR